MGLENLVSFEQGANSKLVYQSQQEYISIEASNEVVKYDSGGQKLWSFALPLDYQHYFGDLPRSGLAAAHVDEQGDLHIALSTQEWMEGYSQTHYYKISGDSGNEIESIRISNDVVGLDRVESLVTADDGSIFIGGSKSYPSDFAEFGSEQRAAILKISTSGPEVVSGLFSFEAERPDENNSSSYYSYGIVKDLAIAGPDEIVAVGKATGFEVNSTASDDLLVYKISGDGDLLWSSSYGSYSSDSVNAVATDQEGNVYVAGEVGGGVDNIWNDNSRPFVSMFNAEGTREWTNILRDYRYNQRYANDISVGNDGRVIVAGDTENSSGYFTAVNADGSSSWTVLTDESINSVVSTSSTEDHEVTISRPGGLYNFAYQDPSQDSVQFTFNSKDILEGSLFDAKIAVAGIVPGSKLYYRINGDEGISTVDFHSSMGGSNAAYPTSVELWPQGEEYSVSFPIYKDWFDESDEEFTVELSLDSSFEKPIYNSEPFQIKDSGISLADDLVELGRDGQPSISKNGKFVAQGLDRVILIGSTESGKSRQIELQQSRSYGNYQIEAVSNNGEKVYLRTWNGFNPGEKIDDQLDDMSSGGSGLYEVKISDANEIDGVQRLDVDKNGNTFTYQGWSPESGDFDLSGDERSIVFAIRDTADSVTWGDQQVKVYKKDLSSGEIFRVDQNIFDDSLGYSSRPRINYDGSKILFESSLDLTGELDSIDSSQGNNIYLWDESNGLSLVNKTPEGSIIESQYGWHANFDQEGRQVVFQTGKALATEDINSISDVYIKNLSSGAIDLISNQTVLKQEPGGEFESQIGGIYPQISPGGKFVYYQKYDYNTEGSYLFAYDIETGLTSDIPGVENTNSPNFSSESIEVLSSQGALLWTWKDYSGSDTDGDADYYFIRHVNDGFDWSSDSLAISYQLNQESPKSALSQIAVLGDAVNEANTFQLSIFAESLLADHLIESTDLTIDFNPKLFGEINASDINIGGALPIANAVRVDNEAGVIRIAAASLADLNQGSGISASTPLASINLDFDEEQIKLLDKNEDGSLKINPLSFQITANDQETVFSKTFTDESGLTNREIVSLADLGGGIEVTGQDVTLYEAKVNLAQQGDGLVLGTQRVIGSDASTTNLVRSGDTLTTSAEWLNVGNIQANNLSYENLYNQNASLVSADFSNSNIASGSFIDGVFVKDARESTVLTTDIKITGEAGNVVDLGDGIVSVKADAAGSDTFSNAGKGSSNLITFQGDLNYDGRVSMKDLAYLNAGAARQQLVESTDENGIAVQVASEASYARDVDADFSGKIDLADLSVLDADWGKTLHTGDEQFQGSADVSWSELDSQGTSSTWENDSFKDQNAIEVDTNYVGSLESPTSNGVIGADGNTTANDNDITGTNFQDQIPA